MSLISTTSVITVQSSSRASRRGGRAIRRENSPGRKHRGRRAFRPRREPSPTASCPGTRSARGVHTLVTLLSAARVTGDAVGSRLHDRRAFRRGGRVPSGRPRAAGAAARGPGGPRFARLQRGPGRTRSAGASACPRGGRVPPRRPDARLDPHKPKPARAVPRTPAGAASWTTGSAGQDPRHGPPQNRSCRLVANT